MKKDPICGMMVKEKDAEKSGLVSIKGKKKYYFCSWDCKNKFDGNKAWYKSESFSKNFPYFLGGVLIFGTIASIYFDFMILYMGIFFLIFSLMKMLDWKGFADVFQTYDLIAGKSRIYAFAYPAIEFAFAVLYLTNSFISIALWTTFIVMGIGAIGVGIKLLRKEKFQCACLGTKINLPLTKVTLLEDLLMAFMALMLLIGI